MLGKQDAGQPDNEYAFSEQIGYLLRRAYQKHLAIFQANASDPQLTSVQFATLCALKDRGPQSQGELVRSTAIDQATIRGIIARLQARSLVALGEDPSDARKVIVTITEEGRTVLDAMIPCARRISELTVERLNPAERLALMHTLRQIIGTDTLE
ncbi:MarR family transcriptional regulator [Mesorhizobium ephedrae]|jgi:DNA-binding MarR family transcriptional regulator|uniref:MarR family transcriptional regulator n=2 Tax=Kumtagia ephedrae TaxID=2116701 RepID=A0A2P7SM02_9HYPH|nr:MarR family winged helix-turn-helix transcriptional regulator [Mesorhizobium ephedrae]PSJ63441.1 MarR family transcriptional regulator [Mesorhizobium ephedrae]